MPENVPFRLAAIDVDGTLVGPDLRVSAANTEAIHRLREAGVTILLASGRSHANILPFYHQLGVEGLVVSVHGAVVRDSDNGEYLLEEPLSPEAVQRITEEGRRLGVSILHYRRAGVFIEQRTLLTEYEQSRNFELQTQIPDLSSDPLAPVHKLVWLAPLERMAELTTIAAHEFAGIANVTHTDPEYLEFTSLTANKANGVATVVQQMGIESAEVIAFGDGNNDIPLLAWAGLGIAMPHASQAVKKISKLVGPAAAVEVALARAIDAIVCAPSDRFLNDGMDFIIRPATPEDAEALISILEGIASERIYTAVSKPWSAEQQRQHQLSLSVRETIHVAESIRGQVVGYQVLELWDATLDSMSHVGQIGTFLAPECRRQGIGHALFERTLEFARKHHYGKLVIQVRSSNVSAQGFYQQLGFRECGRLARQVRIGDQVDDEIIMEVFIE